MTLPATAMIVQRTSGSNSNGGGFNSARGGTNYATQDSAQATGTATSASTTLTATTGIFTSAMVGNYVTDGTTWKEITAFTSSTVVTLDSAPSWTAASIKVGGGVLTIAKAFAIAIAGNYIYLQGAVGTVTVTTNPPTSTSVIGYTTTILDGGTATVNCATGGVYVFDTVNYVSFYNIAVTGNGSAARGFRFNNSSGVLLYNCSVTGTTDYGILIG